MVILILLKVRLKQSWAWPCFLFSLQVEGAGEEAVDCSWRCLSLKLWFTRTKLQKKWTKWWTKSARLFFERRGLWSLTFHDPQLCNVQYTQPDLKYFYSGLWSSTEQNKWNQCHMKCVGNNTKYITEYNQSVQFSTKVITIRIDFNLYFDNIRHICVSIYIDEGLVYSTQRLDERTQSYMRPNVV